RGRAWRGAALGRRPIAANALLKARVLEQAVDVLRLYELDCLWMRGHQAGGWPPTIAMKRVLRVLRLCLWSVLVILGFGGVLVAYYVYTPAPEIPNLSGKLTKGSIEVGGLTRTYTTYVPRGLAKGASLVLAMHGSGENAAQMRIETGYGFDRLADEHGFAVVYPNGYEGYWNGCNVVGDYSANTLNIDDVRFLGLVADKL